MVMAASPTYGQFYGNVGYGNVYGNVSMSSAVPIAGIPGVFKKSGANVNEAVNPYLRALRARVGFDIVVTSGVRSPSSQASVMITKKDTYGVERVRQLYRSQPTLVAEVIAAFPHGHTFVKKVLQAQVARGRFISNHMRSDAVDLRTHGLTSSEKSRLLAASKALGVKSLMEEDHIHTEHIRKAPLTAAAQGAASGLAIMIGIAGAIAVGAYMAGR